MRPCSWSVWGKTDYVQTTMLEKIDALVGAGVSWADIKVTQQMLKAASDAREGVKWQVTLVWPAETQEQVDLAKDDTGYALDLNEVTT